MKKTYYCRFDATVECNRQNRCGIYSFAPDITDDERKIAKKFIKQNKADNCVFDNIYTLDASFQDRVIATVDLCENYVPFNPGPMSPAQRFQR